MNWFTVFNWFNLTPCGIDDVTVVHNVLFLLHICRSFFFVFRSANINNENAFDAKRYLLSFEWKFNWNSISGLFHGKIQAFHVNAIRTSKHLDGRVDFFFSSHWCVSAYSEYDFVSEWCARDIKLQLLQIEYNRRGLVCLCLLPSKLFIFPIYIVGDIYFVTEDVRFK